MLDKPSELEQVCVRESLALAGDPGRIIIHQEIGVIDALLAGAYDGQVACGTLTRQGNVGLGTFDRLDGEMIVLDGRIYQVRADGRVYSPPAMGTTPFAAVVKFRPTTARELSGAITFREFQDCRV